jgi:hypothetical protein
MIKKTGHYKNTNDYLIEIAGSSKSVFKFYEEIQSLKTKSLRYKDEDIWYKDEIVLPHKYEKAMSANLFQEDSKQFYKNNQSIIIVSKALSEDSDFIAEMNNIEKKILLDLEIEYPDTWEKLRDRWYSFFVIFRNTYSKFQLSEDEINHPYLYQRKFTL